MYQVTQANRDRDGSLTFKGLTDYGWVVQRLQEEAYGQGQQWLLNVQARQTSEVLLATLPADDRGGFVAELMARRIGWPLPPWLLAPMSVDGIPLAVGDAGYEILNKRGFFTIVGPDAGAAKSKIALRELWNLGALSNVGTRGLQNLDKAPQIAFAADRIEFILPIEARLSILNPQYTGARLILVCDSPEVLQKVQEFKARANPDRVSFQPPSDLLAALPPRNWRLLRLETNLQPLQAQARKE